MKYPLLSIIVSVYNIEKYINQCVDSILFQTMNDYEVLLIDDGSTDNCSVICDNYANTYENVYAFHKKNGGLSDARNFGIKEARGKYLIFIDGDDYYDDKDFFKKISEALNVYSYPNVINFFHKNIHPQSDKKIEKPALFEEMKAIAAKLSKGMKQVRIDLYEVNGKIYFGEYTFFHGGGFQLFQPPYWEKQLGDWIKL